ncbi:aldo/keto reductase [Streptomyces sp. NPDC007095]|jgi:hypothetical protein|uniref:aldo/keto reductase n=1 Tax=Streptomyces sp. NPDC007095 TaxID=3154482 RepID=UPI00340444D5
MSFGYEMAASRDEETSVSVIRQAIDLGMTLIDTAGIYGPYANEEPLGRALAGGYPRRSGTGGPERTSASRSSASAASGTSACRSRQRWARPRPYWT